MAIHSLQTHEICFATQTVLVRDGRMKQKCFIFSNLGYPKKFSLKVFEGFCLRPKKIDDKFKTGDPIYFYNSDL